MTESQQGILAILHGALTDTAYTLADGFDIEAAAKVARKHRITTLFYYGAIKGGVSAQTPLMQNLFMTAMQDVVINENQQYELGRLFATFDGHAIDYMPLKGTLLKALYPKPEMRPMGDADVLIRTSQYEQIRPLMQELGFTEKLESDHEFVWTKGPVCIELHKRLIPSYNKDYYAYFGDGWRLAKVKDGVRYAMTDEDQFVYLFTHFAKHYRDAGIGLRHMVDLWVYKTAHRDLDEAYIRSELKALQLDVFYTHICHTLAVWFEGAQADERADFITAILFNSGVYGTNESRLLSAALKKAKTTGNARSVRTKSFFAKVFLPYTAMCGKFPVLKKAPFLLPVFWLVRIVTVVLFKRKNLESAAKEYQTTSADNIEAYQQALNFVGLDFNFKEQDI